MANRAALAAGVISLLLVGSWGVAQAESSAAVNGEAGTTPGVLELLGKTYCFSKTVPPGVQCDWRMPDIESARAAKDREVPSFTMFGMRFCVAKTWSKDCDIPLLAQVPAKKPTGKTFSIAGVDFCLGEVEPTATCDVKIPALKSAYDDEQTGALAAN